MAPLRRSQHEALAAEVFGLPCGARPASHRPGMTYVGSSHDMKIVHGSITIYIYMYICTHTRIYTHKDRVWIGSCHIVQQGCGRMELSQARALLKVSVPAPFRNCRRKNTCESLTSMRAAARHPPCGNSKPARALCPLAAESSEPAPLKTTQT